MADRYNLFPNEKLIAQYRNVFSGQNGQDVLTHMLYDLGVFVHGEGPEDEALRNYGVRLLEILGGGEVGKEAMLSMIEGLKRQEMSA